MTLQMDSGFRHLIWWVGTFLLFACSQEVVVQPGVQETQPINSPTPVASDAILSRGNLGRTGSFGLPAITSPVDVTWERNVGTSVHGAPLVVEETLLVPTVDARFTALDRESGEEKWTFRDSGDLFSSPAVAEDVVYIGNENGNLYALDLDTGNELWSAELNAGIWTAPLVVGETIFVGSQAGTVYAIHRANHEVLWQFETDGWVVSPPAWDDGMVFVSGGKNLYALHPNSGEVLWQKSIGEFWGPHAVRAGVLYAGNDDNSFYALDAKTGDVLWSFDAGDNGWSAPAVSAESVFFGNRLSQLFALDSKTGALQWTFEAEDWATTDPVVVNGAVYLAVGNHDNRDGPRPLYAIDAETGKELWRFETDGRLLTPPAIADDGIYVVSFPGTVYALTPKLVEAIQYRGDAGRSGVYDEPALRESTRVKWQRSFEEDAYFPMYASGTLYIGTANGQLLALDPESGQERWSYSVDDGPILAVAVAGDSIYFGAGDNGFYALDARDGKLAWSSETDGSVWSSSPLLITDMAYFGSDTGVVYALDLNTHETAWTFQAASGVLWQLAGDNERIYVPTQKDLYALDRVTGAELWRAETPDKWNAPAVSHGIVYTGNGSREFVALDAETGERRWSFRAPFTEWSEWSAPVVTEENVYIGYSNNFMYALDRNTGEREWEFEAEDWATSDPIYADGILYFGVGAHANLADSTEDRLFYALDAATGEELWSFQANGLIYSAAAIGKGAIYFKTLENTLYAIH